MIARCMASVEHPHVVTIGRNGKHQNLSSADVLARTWIEFHESPIHSAPGNQTWRLREICGN